MGTIHGASLATVASKGGDSRGAWYSPQFFASPYGRGSAFWVEGIADGDRFAAGWARGRAHLHVRLFSCWHESMRLGAGWLYGGWGWNGSWWGSGIWTTRRPPCCQVGSFGGCVFEGCRGYRMGVGRSHGIRRRLPRPPEGLILNDFRPIGSVRSPRGVIRSRGCFRL